MIAWCRRLVAAAAVAASLVACTRSNYTPNVIQLTPNGTASSPASQSIAKQFTLIAVEDGYTGQFTADTVIGTCWVVRAPVKTTGAWIVVPQGSTCSTDLDVEKIVVKDLKGNAASTYIRSTK